MYAKVCHLIFLKALHVLTQATQNIYEHDVIGWFTVCISEVRWPYWKLNIIMMRTRSSPRLHIFAKYTKYTALFP